MSKDKKIFPFSKMSKLQKDIEYEMYGDALAGFEGFDKIEDLLDEAYYTNKDRRKNVRGASTYFAILSSMVNSEIFKQFSLISAQSSELSEMLLDAYCQNKKIDKYLKSTDIFMFADEYKKELDAIVNDLFVGDERFEEIISRGLNYAQFATIYAFDPELERAKKIKPKHTEFELKVLSSGDRDAVKAIFPSPGLGQSAYVAIFGGRVVCAGIAELTAGIIDRAFKLSHIKADAYTQTIGDHAVVGIREGGKTYIVDPTNYFGSFKAVLRENKLVTKELGKDFKGLDLREYDTEQHFVVLNYFIKKFDMQKRIDKIVAVDDLIPNKLTKIICFMQNNLSKMSKLIYPKAVFVDNFEINVQFFFEMCLKGAYIPYKTGLADYQFVIKDGEKKYYVDTYKIFTADNKINQKEKFLQVKQARKIQDDLQKD